MQLKFDFDSSSRFRVFESLLTWYRMGFLGRRPPPLDSKPGSSCQSFLSIATVAWAPRISWPKVQSALASISNLRPLCAQVSWVSALYVPKFLKVLKKFRSIAILFRAVAEGVVLLHGHSKPEHCLSISPPRSVSVGQSALGWHAVCYLTSPY